MSTLRLSDDLVELIDRTELRLRHPDGEIEGDPAEWPAWTDEHRFVPTDSDANWWAEQTCDREQPDLGPPPAHSWRPSRWTGGEH